MVFDGEFGDYNASDTVKFTTADFIGPSGMSEPIEDITTTILGNNNVGHLKVKFRYYKDGYPYPDDQSNGWTNWYYHTKTYQTIAIVVTEFIGPEMICSEGTFNIANPGTITLENASGIATLTNLGGNTYKITRIGSSVGKVTLKSVTGSNTYTKEIKIGASSHLGTIKTMPRKIIGPGTYSVEFVDSGNDFNNVIWSVSSSTNTVSIYNNGPKKATLHVNSWNTSGTNAIYVTINTSTVCGEPHTRTVLLGDGAEVIDPDI